MKKDGEIVTFKSSAEFHSWLSKSHSFNEGIWIRVYKKASGVESITIEEALIEALCSGWIDGQRKSYDEKSYLQRYCPRRNKSIWSKRNVALAEELTQQGRMRPNGLKAIEAAKADGRWDRAYDGQKDMKVPEDFLRELRKNKEARECFKALKRSEVFVICLKLQSAATPKTRKRRLTAAIEALGKNSSSKRE